MKLLPDKPIARMILIFAVSYVLLLGLGNFGGLREAYGATFRGVSAKIFRNWFDKGYVVINEGKDPTGKEMDSAARFYNRKQNDEAAQKGTSVYSIIYYFSTYLRGYLMTIFYLALVFASPVPLKRKAISGLVGFLLVQGFIIFRLYIGMCYTIQENPKLEILDPSPFMQSVVSVLDLALVRNIVLAFIIPLLIWILVTFNREDRQTLKVLMTGSRAATAK